MTDDRTDNPHRGDPYARIEELEQQVRELSGLIERMLDRQVHPEDDDPAPILDDPDQLDLHERPLQLDLSTLLESFGQRIGKVLGGEEGESLESRVGGIWLSKIAAVLIMTVAALGFALTLREAPIESWQKVAAGYALSAAALLFGMLSKDRLEALPQTMVGWGLAGLYFTTYAMVAFEDVRLITNPNAGLTVLGSALAIVFGAVYWSRSVGAAWVVLLLVAYTVFLTLQSAPGRAELLFSMTVCVTVTAVACVSYLRHRWLSFLWGGMAAAYLAAVLLLGNPAGKLEWSDAGYFWLLMGVLTGCFACFALAAARGVRGEAADTRPMAAFACANTFIYVWLTWAPVREHVENSEWVFRLALCILLLIFAGTAYRSGPRLNSVFQLFVLGAAILFTLALVSRVPGAAMNVALALECAAFALAYRQTGLVLFKAIGLGFLGITFVNALLTVRTSDPVDLIYVDVPENWFVCVVAATILTSVAAFYEHFVQRLHPADRTSRGQWFLADGLFDIRSTTAAVYHAAAASMILTALIIIDLGDDPDLPFILAGASLAMVVWGLILRTAQIDVAGVLLLAAAHVTYHSMLFMERPGFGDQAYFVELSAVIALLTYVGGFLWERYLSRIVGGSALEHDLLAGIPYLASTLMLVTLASRELAPQYAAVALNVLAVLLMLATAVARLTGVRASGVLAMALGTSLYFIEMYNFDAPLAVAPDFILSLAAMLLSFVATERLVLLWGRDQREVHDSTPDFVRTLVITVGAMLGVLGLWEWSPPEGLVWWLLGLSVLAMVCGVVFQESRYRWAAIGIYLTALTRGLSYDLTESGPVDRFMKFGGLCMPLLLFIWGYSRYRARALRALHERSGSYGQQA